MEVVYGKRRSLRFHCDWRCDASASVMAWYMNCISTTHNRGITMLVRSILLGTFLFAACGTDSRDFGGGGDDTGSGSDDMGSGSGSDMPTEPADLTIVSKDVTLMPGEEATYCYYFHTPNADTLAIR